MLAYLVNHEDFFATSNEYLVFTAQTAIPPRARTAVGNDIVQKYYVDEAEKMLAPVDKFLQRHGLFAKSSWKVAPVGTAISELQSTGAAGSLIGEGVKSAKKVVMNNGQAVGVSAYLFTA